MRALTRLERLTRAVRRWLGRPTKPRRCCRTDDGAKIYGALEWVLLRGSAPSKIVEQLDWRADTAELAYLTQTHDALLERIDHLTATVASAGRSTGGVR